MTRRDLSLWRNRARKPRAPALPLLALAAVGFAAGCSPVPPAAAPAGRAAGPSTPRTATPEAAGEAPLDPSPAQAAPIEAPEAAEPAGAAAAVRFETQILPILSGRCRPCHFEGGKMYERLPFDRPQTIHTLGTRLFTRIKEPEEQALIQAFLAEGGESPRPPD